VKTVEWGKLRQDWNIYSNGETNNLAKLRGSDIKGATKMSLLTELLAGSFSANPPVVCKARFSVFRFIPDPVSGGFRRKVQVLPKVFRQVEVLYVTIDEQDRGNGLFGKVFEATSGDGPTGIVP